MPEDPNPERPRRWPLTGALAALLLIEVGLFWHVYTAAHDVRPALGGPLARIWLDLVALVGASAGGARSRGLAVTALILGAVIGALEFSTPLPLRVELVPVLALAGVKAGLAYKLRRSRAAPVSE